MLLSHIISPNIHLAYMSNQPSIHLTWYNINPSIHLVSSHLIHSKSIWILKNKVETKPTNHVIIQDIKNTILSSNLNETMHIHCKCMTYLYLPCSNSTPMTSCMSMWMNGIVSKQETLRENPNLAYNNKQTCKQRKWELKSIQEG